MAYNRIKDIILENVRIIFRNFSGKPTKFNRDGGVRSFAVIIEDAEKAQKFADIGWNIRILKPRDEDEAPSHYLPVTVSFKNIPPKIYIVTRKKKTLVTEEIIDTLDYAEIRNVDIVIRPYNWEVNGGTGIKAYVKTMYITIEEDAFVDKYADQEYPGDDDEVPF